MLSVRLSLPGFATNATDDWTDGPPGAARSPARARLALAEALTASHPVTSPERLAGRRQVMRQLIAAVEQQRAHVVLYGERGIGKTSLLHVFAETAREARYQVLYGSCGVEARFSDMFRSFAERLPLLYHAHVSPTADEAEHQQSFANLLPPNPGPREFADIFAEVVGTRVVLMLDEYDRVADPAFRRDVAELIKNLSDRAARVQLVLAGVAANLDELVGFTPSIRRNIVGLHVPPLLPDEVRDILDMGEEATGLTFADDARAAITAMAAGSPYIARLLGARAGSAALDAGLRQVGAGQVRQAAESTLGEWNAGLPRRVRGHLARPDVRAAWPVLLAAARASGSPDGWFGADDVEADGAARALDGFVEGIDLFERADGPGGARYRFRTPGLAQFLTLSAAAARA